MFYFQSNVWINSKHVFILGADRASRHHRRVRPAHAKKNGRDYARNGGWFCDKKKEGVFTLKGVFTFKTDFGFGVLKRRARLCL